MKKNIGRFDQILRMGIGLGLIYIGFIDTSFIDDPLSSNIIGGFGALNIFVALLRSCPLYSLTGISTCQEKTK